MPKKTKADAKEAEVLQRWQTKHHNAKGSYADRLSLMDEREAIYLGTREVDGNPNSNQNPTKVAANVRNIAFEFIESQIDSNIPQPKVDAQNPEDIELAAIVEDVLRADLSRINFEAMNDRQERVCPIQGMSFFEIYYDRTLKGRRWIGDVNARLIHPKSFIPQPGVYSGLEDMDYFFIVSSVTKDYIRKRYGQEKYDQVESEAESDPNVNSIGEQKKNTDNLTEIVAWFKNDKSRPGRVVWVNDTLMEHIDDYYARLLERCVKCGALKPDGDEPCECGSKKFAKTASDAEILVEPIMDGENARIPAGTIVPFYIPTAYPIIMRENVPQSFEFGGQSDIDVVRDQQDAIKKVASKIQEKILKGGSIVALPNSLKNKISLDDAELKVAWVQPGENQMIGTYALQPNIEKDMTFYMEQYRAAQSTLGITDTFQGKPDPTAESGLAKQLQINQSGGRLQSKRSNKHKAYKDLYKLMFQFKLAFLDEPRNIRTLDENGQPVYKKFYRYDFLKQDDAGEWYYDDEFLFAVDSTGGFGNDRNYLYEQAMRQFQSGMYGNPTDPAALSRVWQALESLHFPMSGDIKEQFVKEAALAQQMKMQLHQAQLQAAMMGISLSPDGAPRANGQMVHNNQNASLQA